MPHLKLITPTFDEPVSFAELPSSARARAEPTIVERFLLLKLEQAASRQCICLGLQQRNRWTWQTVRINLNADGGERDREVLSLSTDPAAATAKYKATMARMLAASWFPPGCPQLDPMELARRFVDHWPRIPTMLDYQPRLLVRDLSTYRHRWSPRRLCLRQYSGGRRMLLQLNTDYTVTLSNGSGLREATPAWVGAGLATVPLARLPALFEIRAYNDRVAFSDLLQAKRDYRLEKFTRRWQVLHETLAGASAVWNGARFGFDPLLSVTSLPSRIDYAMHEGYDEVVVHDTELPYYYGEANDLRPYIAWRRDERHAH